MSVPARRKRTFVWAIVCRRKMDEVGIPFYYSSHSKQNSLLCFDRQIFQVWTPKPATLYQILTIWGLIINLNLKCGESLMVFSQVFYDTSHHFWHFCTKVRALHTLELNSNIKESFKQPSYVTGDYEPSCSWMGLMNLLTQPLSDMFLKCTADSASSSCIFTPFMCGIWVHVDKGHCKDSQMEDARGQILVRWSSPVRSFICAQSDQLNEIVYSPACRNRNCDWLFPWLFHLRVSLARCSRHSSDLKV